MNTNDAHASGAQEKTLHEQANDALGHRIAMLSMPRSSGETARGESEIWKQALAAAASEAPRDVQHVLRTRARALPARTTGSWLASRRASLAVGSVAALLAIAGGLLVIPALGKARSSARSTSAGVYESDVMMKVPAQSMPSRVPPTATAPTSGSALVSGSGVGGSGLAGSGSANDRMATAAPDATRMLVQQVSLEIVTKDVRGTFTRAQGLLRSDLGEYVQQSNLIASTIPDARGVVGTLTGSLVIRVRHERLQETLANLRLIAGLDGSVRSEAASASDVTDQAVDLDARILSEQRLETELLRLVETRGQLSELLELRTRLATVRESIERLQAKRDSLARQVSYATISLSLIDAGKTASQAPSASRWSGMSENLAAAWQDGLSGLVSVLAFLLRVLVGGLPIWIAAAGGAWLARVLWRKRLGRLAQEPVPFAS